jgi:beta-exotoxin I transport system permease protein
MTVMLRKAQWDIRWTAFWFAIGGGGYTFMVALFYPSIRKQSEQVTQLIASYPKGFLTALGYTDMTTFAGFISVESLNLFWPIIVGVFATLAGASLVAKEVEDGTSEIWLSIPAERWRLLLAKMAALAIALSGAVVVAVLAVELSAILVGASVSIAGLLALGVVMAAFLFAIASYSGLLSTLFSSRGVAAGIAFGITLGFYALYLVGGLADGWKQLKDFSIFTAYTPQKALETGAVDVLPILVLLALAALCAAASLFTFQRRDAI